MTFWAIENHIEAGDTQNVHIRIDHGVVPWPDAGGNFLCDTMDSKQERPMSFEVLNACF
jgi:hypothetical protein